MARTNRNETYGRELQLTPWWAAKRYGYGANLPIAWQGWAVMLAYFAVLAGACFLFLPDQILAFLAMILAATALFLVIVKRRTRGGWRWRWGEEQ
jgi:hypothetical protein